MKEDSSFLLRIPTEADEQVLKRIKADTKKMAKTLSYYKCAMLEVETRFNVLNEEYLLEQGRSPINSVKSRLKTLPSLQEKLERRNLPFSMEVIETEIHDIAGVRVICGFPEDVRVIAEAFLKQDDIVLLQKKDYITNPKANGYRSLHLIVAVPIYLSSGKRMTKVEIQLRTIAMDFWASLEHQMKYKQEIPDEQAIMDELRDCAAVIRETDERMLAIRRRIEAAADAPTEEEVLFDKLAKFDIPIQ